VPWWRGSRCCGGAGEVACGVHCINFVGTVRKSCGRQVGVGRGRADGNTVPLAVRSPRDAGKITDRDSGVDQVGRAGLCALYHGIAGVGNGGSGDAGSRCRGVEGHAVARGAGEVACGVHCINFVGTVHKSCGRQVGVGRGRTDGNTVPLAVRSPRDAGKITDRDSGFDQVGRAGLCALYNGIAGVGNGGSGDAGSRCRGVRTGGGII